MGFLGGEDKEILIIGKMIWRIFSQPTGRFIVKQRPRYLWPMRVILTLLFLAGIKTAFSQGIASQYYGAYSFGKGTLISVFSDTAFIRSQASASAAVLDTVYAFDDLRIMDTAGGLLTLGRKTAPWYRVTYSKNDKKRQGVIWGGALAMCSIRKKSMRFACGLLSYPMAAASQPEEEPKELQYFNTFSIKAKDAKGRQECRYNISRESVYFYEDADSNGKVTDTHTEKAKGLPAGAQYLIRFNMSGEACGIPSYRIMAAWDGTKLIKMPLLQSNVDGDQWYYEEQFVYPKDEGGKAGKLLIKCKEETAVEGTDKIETNVTWKEYYYDQETARFLR